MCCTTLRLFKVLLWHHFCFYKRRKILLALIICLPIAIMALMYVMFSGEQKSTANKTTFKNCKTIPRPTLNTAINGDIIDFLEPGNCKAPVYGKCDNISQQSKQDANPKKKHNSVKWCNDGMKVNLSSSLKSSALDDGPLNIDDVCNFFGSVGSSENIPIGRLKQALSGDILYYPNNNSNVERIMDTVRQQLRELASETFQLITDQLNLTTNISQSSCAHQLLANRVRGFLNIGEVLKYSRATFSSQNTTKKGEEGLWGIVGFNTVKSTCKSKSSNPILNIVDYELFYDYRGQPSQQLIDLQTVIDSAILVSGRTQFDPKALYTQSLPTKCIKRPTGGMTKFLRFCLPLIMMFCFLLAPLNCATQILTEKSLKLRDYMTVVGVSSLLLKLSWAVFYLLILVPLSVIVAMMIVMLPGGQLANTYWMYIFILAVSFNISQLCFVFLLCACLSTPKISTKIIMFLHVLCLLILMVIIPSPADLHGAALVGAIILSLYPVVPMAIGLNYIFAWEATYLGLRSELLFVSPFSSDSFGGFGTCIIFQIGSSLLYILLAWYIEQIAPGEFGVRRKPWFFFMPSYWCGDKISRPETEAHADNHAVSHGLIINGLTKVYSNGHVGVSDLSIIFSQSEITAFLGQNGAGKSTTLNSIVGLIHPTAGTININDEKVLDGQKFNQSVIAQQVAFVPQHDILYPSLTVAEHMMLYGKIREALGSADKEVYNTDNINEALKSVGMEEHRDTIATSLSGGQKRKLSVLIAYQGSPSVVLLDEPTSGVDPHSRRMIWDLLLANKYKTATVLSTHHMQEADVLADNIAIIAGGTLRASGTPLSLKRKFGKGTRIIFDTNLSTPNIVTRDLTGHSIPVNNISEIDCRERLGDFFRRFGNHIGSKSTDVDIEAVEELRQTLLKNQMGHQTMIETQGTGGDQNVIQFVIPSSATKLQVFIDFLSQLERMQSSLGFSSMGIAESTVEEIFFAVTDMASKSKAERHEAGWEDNVSGKHTGNVDILDYCVDYDGLNCVHDDSTLQESISYDKNDNEDRNNVYRQEAGSEDSNQSSVTNRTRSTLGKSALSTVENQKTETTIATHCSSAWLGRQIQGLLLKRFSYWRRSKASFVYQFLYPLAFVILVVSSNKDGNGKSVWLSDEGVGRPSPLAMPEPFLGHHLVFLKYTAGTGKQDTVFTAMARGLIQNGFGPQCQVNDHRSVPSWCGSRSNGSNIGQFKLPVQDSQRLTVDDIDSCSHECSSLYCFPKGSDAFDRVPRVELPSSEYLYNLNYVEKSLGQQTALEMDTIVESADTIRDWIIAANNSHNVVRGGFAFVNSQKSGTDKQAVIVYAAQGYGQLMLNGLSNILIQNQASAMRNQSPKKWTCDANVLPGIRVSLTPAELNAEEQSIFSVVAELIAVILALILLVQAFIFTTYAVAEFVTMETFNGLKRLQKISGVHWLTYWVINTVFDYTIYLISVCIIMILLATCPNSFEDNIVPLLLVVLLFGIFSISFVYLMTFFLKTKSGIDNLITITQLVGICMTFATVFELLFGLCQLFSPGETESCKPNAYYVISWLNCVFRIFPPVYLGNTLAVLVMITTLKSKSQTGMMAGASSMFPENIYEWDWLGKRMVQAMVTSACYFAIVLLLESLNVDIHAMFRRCRQKISKKNVKNATDPAILDMGGKDPDVEAEEHRILSNVSSGDEVDVLQVTNIHKHYVGAPTEAVHNVSFGVPRGQCFGLLGTNGAGKSSLFKMLTGYIRPSSGNAMIDGREATRQVQRCGRGGPAKFSYCPQENILFDCLTVHEHLLFTALIKGISCSDARMSVIPTLLQQTDLEEHAHKLPPQLSGGNQRKLQLALSLMPPRPPVIFLDEPTTGMDPGARRRCWETISDASENPDRCAVILTSHTMEECEALCGRVVFMVSGQFYAIGGIQYLKYKFGNKYIVEIRLQTAAENENACSNEQIGNLMSAVETEFPDSKLLEQHHGMCKWEVPLGIELGQQTSTGGITLSRVFQVLIQLRNKFPFIADYSVSQVNFEHVFMQLAQKQEEFQSGLQNSTDAKQNNQKAKVGGEKEQPNQQEE